MSLAALDLNLLLVLHEVLSERSVARAAERLHVTSSAVSNSLARLRARLGDPLVIRHGRGIVATPRALELLPVVARALEALERAVQNTPFDAANCARTFTLALADAGQIAFLPRIGRTLSAEMPRARLRVVGIDSLVSLGDLGSSELDLQIGMAPDAPNVHAEPLFEEQLSLVARADHPAARQRLSAQQLARLRHVDVELVPGRNFQSPAAVAYAQAGLERDVAIRVPSFTAAAAIASSGDWVTLLPASLLAVLSASFQLRALATSVPLPTVTMALCWHERTHVDPALVAFRELVRRALGASARPAEPTARASKARRPPSARGTSGSRASR